MKTTKLLMWIVAIPFIFVLGLILAVLAIMCFALYSAQIAFKDAWPPVFINIKGEIHDKKS